MNKYNKFIYVCVILLGTSSSAWAQIPTDTFASSPSSFLGYLAGGFIVLTTSRFISKHQKPER